MTKDLVRVDARNANNTDWVSLTRSRSLMDPLLRIVLMALGTLSVVGFIWSLHLHSLDWGSMATLWFLWPALRPSRLYVGLDGISHRGPMTTAYSPFESMDDAKVERISDNRCRILFGNRERRWTISSGIDETEKAEVQDWLQSAITLSKEGAAFSKKFAENVDAVSTAEDATLLRLSTGFGTQSYVRALAMANLVSRDSRHLPELRNVANHILSANFRRLAARALRANSADQLNALRTQLEPAFRARSVGRL